MSFFGMRCIAALVVLLVGFPAMFAQKQGQLYTASREQLDVTKVVLAQEKAWNQGDLNAYLAVFKDADDTEAILNGPVRGFAVTITVGIVTTLFTATVLARLMMVRWYTARRPALLPV